jgi:hypothetical protein
MLVTPQALADYRRNSWSRAFLQVDGRKAVRLCKKHQAEINIDR